MYCRSVIKSMTSQIENSTRDGREYSDGDQRYYVIGVGVGVHVCEVVMVPFVVVWGASEPLLGVFSSHGCCDEVFGVCDS